MQAGPGLFLSGCLVSLQVSGLVVLADQFCVQPTITDIPVFSVLDGVGGCLGPFRTRQRGLGAIKGSSLAWCVSFFPFFC